MKNFLIMATGLLSVLAFSGCAKEEAAAPAPTGTPQSATPSDQLTPEMKAKSTAAAAAAACRGAASQETAKFVEMNNEYNEPRSGNELLLKHYRDQRSKLTLEDFSKILDGLREEPDAEAGSPSLEDKKIVILQDYLNLPDRPLDVRCAVKVVEKNVKTSAKVTALLADFYATQKHLMTAGDIGHLLDGFPVNPGLPAPERVEETANQNEARVALPNPRGEEPASDDSRVERADAELNRAKTLVAEANVLIKRNLKDYAAITRTDIVRDYVAKSNKLKANDATMLVNKYADPTERSSILVNYTQNHIQDMNEEDLTQVLQQLGETNDLKISEMNEDTRQQVLSLWGQELYRRSQLKDLREAEKTAQTTAEKAAKEPPAPAPAP